MTTGLFFKKSIKIGISLLLVTIFLFTAVFAFVLSKAKRIEISKNFYFLVADSSHIQASVEVALLQGGAAYIMDGKVVYSVYFNFEDGNAVWEKTPQTKLVERKIDCLYLISSTQKEKGKIYQTAFDNLYECILYLENLIAELEKGMTQEEVQKKLKVFSKHTNRLKKTYENTFSICANIFKGLTEKLEEISHKTVFASKLRYILCDLAKEYIAVASHFQV
jgi:hypothetical protein